MIEHIHQSNLIEGFDSLEADKQSMAAWKWLKRQEHITFDTVRGLQEKITLHQANDMAPEWRGYTRSTPQLNVYIGGRVGSPWTLVDGLLHNWLLDWLDMPPKQAHIKFEKIHPFMDGNGRTGRMLMWWQEIKNGNKPTLITKKDVWNYYDWFK